MTRALPAYLLSLLLLCLACIAPTQPDPPPEVSIPQPGAIFDPGDAPHRFGSTLLALTSGAVTVDVYQDGLYFYVVARNTHHGAVTLDARMELTNLRYVTPYNPTFTLAGGGPDAPPVLVSVLTYIDPAQRWAATLYPNGHLGSHLATPAPYLYALPYRAGEAYKILQGPGGSFSHTGDMFHAVDFDMPEGTTIVAMREGKVAFTHVEATTGGPDPALAQLITNANIVVIEHDDGTIIMYTHLRHQGALVQPGQRVARGQPIGLSGATGFATKPHLHAVLMTAQDAYTPKTFPLTLQTYPGDPGTIALQDALYTAFERY